MNTMTPSAFPVTVATTWTEIDVIPPGCRKPRSVDHEIEHVVNVPMISSADFPVAMIARDWQGEKAYHLYDGHLYVPYLPQSRQTEMFTAGSEDFSANQRESGYNRHATLDGMHAQINRRYESLLIVDGKVWTRTANEPYYQVSVSDGGWNGPRTTYISVTGHSNQAEYTHFNANEREEAIAYALSQTAEHEQPALLEKLATRETMIEVLIPEAVKQTFNRVKAQGESTIYHYANKVENDFKAAMEHSGEFVDAEAVGRGEITYREYLEAALKHLLEVEEPRQREREATRGW